MHGSVAFPHRCGPIFCDSQAWMMPSRVNAASAQKPFTSISSQIRPTHRIHCKGVIHIKWARPKLWRKNTESTTFTGGRMWNTLLLERKMRAGLNIMGCHAGTGPGQNHWALHCCPTCSESKHRESESHCKEAVTSHTLTSLRQTLSYLWGHMPLWQQFHEASKTCCTEDRKQQFSRLTKKKNLQQTVGFQFQSVSTVVSAGVKFVGNAFPRSQISLSSAYI